MLKHKGYTGKVIEFDDDLGVFHGEVIDTNDVITFQGINAGEVKKAFRESIDDYLDFCASRSEEPGKPVSGRFVLRVPPSLHRQIRQIASSAGKSLNQWIVDTIKNAIRVR